MQRIALSLIALASILTACQSGGKQQTADGQKLTVSNQLLATVLENRVRDIYADVFREYNNEDSLRKLDIAIDHSVDEYRDAFIQQYCSKKWGTLVSEIDKIDSTYHSGDLGFWEADYWIQGNDWGNLSISDVRVVTYTDDEAVVELNLHNLETVKPVILAMVKEDDVWKIDNFKDAERGFDWKKAMMEYVNEETANNNKKK